MTRSESNRRSADAGRSLARNQRTRMCAKMTMTIGALADWGVRSGDAAWVAHGEIRHGAAPRRARGICCRRGAGWFVVGARLDQLFSGVRDHLVAALAQASQMTATMSRICRCDWLSSAGGGGSGETVATRQDLKGTRAAVGRGTYSQRVSWKSR